MDVLDHVSITVRDLARVMPFYDAVFAALGVLKVYSEADAAGYGERKGTYLSIFQSEHARADPRRHWCFRAPSADAVRAFHAAGLAAGGRDAGAPGLRPHYHPRYFAAFLEDAEGNRIEAVWHGE